MIVGTLYIGPANYVQFDKGMNNLPCNNHPPNQRDLERAELGNNFPSKPKEVEVANKLQFCQNGNGDFDSTTYVY